MHDATQYLFFQEPQVDVLGYQIRIGIRSKGRAFSKILVHTRANLK